MKGFLRVAPELKVLRGLPCDYEVVDASLQARHSHGGRAATNPHEV
jgi:hypothetical protein